MSLENRTPPGAKTRTTTAQARLRKMAMSLPEVREDHPWGHSAFKVGKKAFLFMASENGGLSLSVKLPQSGLLALSLSFAQPTGYGLGKSGWVTASFTPKQSPPLPVLERWVEESYRTIAPKKLVARLEGAVKPSRPSRGGAR
jgi:predicted DNA-binding protein (MmcQ/YjbR family)